MKTIIKSVAAGMGLAVVLCGAAQAGTLEDVKARGKFICGTLGTAEPFSFQDPKTRAVVGFEVDMCQKIADSLNVPLELKPIAVEARIPELIGNRVDLVAANMGWSPERAQQIDYSFQHFVSPQKVLARQSDADLKSPADLAGQRVSAVRGSSSEQGARKNIPDVDPLTFKDPSGAFLALQQRKVQGFVASELMLVKLQQQAADSNVPVKILEPALFVEPWGLGIRKGDTAFLNHVNQVLEKMETSGDAQKLFDKWLGEDTAYKLKRDYRFEAIKG